MKLSFEKRLQQKASEEMTEKQIRESKSCCRITVRQSRSTSKQRDLAMIFNETLKTCNWCWDILILEVQEDELLSDKCDFDWIESVIRISVESFCLFSKFSVNASTGDDVESDKTVNDNFLPSIYCCFFVFDLKKLWKPKTMKKNL